MAKAASPARWKASRSIWSPPAAASSEGPYAPFDYQSGYLKHLLGFIGLTDIREVRMEGTVLGADAVQAAIAKAGHDVQALVEQAG